MNEIQLLHLVTILKGAGNHRRLQILLLLSQTPHLCLEQIHQRTGSSLPTIAEHVQRLTLAGLVRKRYRGREVEHDLVPLGKKILTLLSGLLQG
jgi:DNA-binding transcriptional ArsR family regulator